MWRPRMQHHHVWERKVESNNNDGGQDRQEDIRLKQNKMNEHGHSCVKTRVGRRVHRENREKMCLLSTKYFQ